MFFCSKVLSRSFENLITESKKMEIDCLLKRPDAETTVTTETPTGRFERMAVGDSYTVSNFTITAANEDITEPGKITDVRVIDINSETPATGSTKNYTITWIATGDDVNVGQGSVN